MFIFKVRKEKCEIVSGQILLKLGILLKLKRALRSLQIFKLVFKQKDMCRGPLDQIRTGREFYNRGTILTRLIAQSLSYKSLVRTFLFISSRIFSLIIFLLSTFHGSEVISQTSDIIVIDQSMK